MKHVAYLKSGFRWGVTCVCLASALFWVSGCRQEKPSMSIIPLEGKVEKVEARPDGTGTITILYFNEKKGQEVADKGEVTKETEIMINGAVASLADIKIGERVRGEVKVEKVGEERRHTALKINIDRAMATPPAGG